MLFVPPQLHSTFVLLYVVPIDYFQPEKKTFCPLNLGKEIKVKVNIVVLLGAF